MTMSTDIINQYRYPNGETITPLLLPNHDHEYRYNQSINQSSVGDPDPKGASYLSEKVIFSQQHFQYFSFSPNHEKNFRTFGQN
jgi:hypothetical protein